MAQGNELSVRLNGDLKKRIRERVRLEDERSRGNGGDGVTVTAVVRRALRLGLDAMDADDKEKLK